ncbi:MAG: hypothetical protein ACUVT7_08395 [Thermoplasmata archaeon]
MPSFRMAFSQGPNLQPVRAKLFGIGSAGCNIIEGSRYPTIAFSTSTADIARSHADRKVLIGIDRLVGLSDSSPDLLKHVQEVVGHEVFDVFNNTEIAILMCGLGGMTGSLGVKLLCSIAKAKGSTAIVLAATPFSQESSRRRELAAKTLDDLLKSSALCVEFDNDKLSSLAPNLPLSRAFSVLNSIMLRPVMDLCSTMSRDDVTRLRQIVAGANYGRFGLGLARGDDRIERVVAEALSSPWFDCDFGDVKTAIAIYSSADPWDKEIERVLLSLESRLPSARILWGSYSEKGLADRIRLSLILCRQK